MKLASFVLAFAALVLASTHARASKVLFGFRNTTSELVRIDPSTGAATTVGISGIGGISGLTFDPQRNRLVGYPSSNTGAVTFNLLTGETNSLGDKGAGAINGLEYDPASDSYFATQSALQELVLFDPESGLQTLTALPQNGVTRLAYDERRDLLYAIDDLADEIVTIDRSTGALGRLGSPGFSSAGRLVGLAIDWDSDTLFGIEVLADVLVTLDRQTGAATTIGGTGLNGVTTIAFVPSALIPEPTTATLLILGVMGTASRRTG